MTQQYRLNHGGLVDRRRPLTFRFDGIQYQGYHGDTLASALLANGVHLVGRSFKYHRPRGIYTAGVEEMNALVDVLKGGPGRPGTPGRRWWSWRMASKCRARTAGRRCASMCAPSMA